MLKGKLQKITGPIFFFLGCLLLYFLIQRFGVSELLESLQRLGWNVGFILFLPVLWYACHTIAWYFVMEETGTHVSFFSLYKIKLIGEAVNSLTPISFMGGDPVRIYILQKRMPGVLSTASIVLDRTMQSLAVVFLVLIGLVVAWSMLSLPTAWKFAFPALTAFMVFLLWFAIHRQRKGVFEFLSRMAAKIGIKHHLTDSIQEKIEVLDERISRFYRHDRRRFLTVFCFHFLARLLGVFEIYIIAHFLSIPLGISGALILVSLSVLVNMFFVFIPGSMGVMEGAYGALFLLMGLNPVSGVAVQLIRRIRTVFWIFIGLFFVLIYSRFRGTKEILFAK